MTTILLTRHRLYVGSKEGRKNSVVAMTKDKGKHGILCKALK